MEYCDKGDLGCFIQRMQNPNGASVNSLMNLGESRVWKLFIQICLALEVIHE